MLMRTLVAQRLPGLLSKLTHIMPITIQKFLISQLLQRVFKEALASGDIDFLEGSFIRFEIVDCNYSWTYTYDGQLLQIVDVNQADASIRCNLQEFVLLINRKIDPDTLFFQRRLIIEGDTELGLAMKNLMDTLEPESLPLPLIKGLQVMEHILDYK